MSLTLWIVRLLQCGWAESEGASKVAAALQGFC